MRDLRHMSVNAAEFQPGGGGLRDPENDPKQLFNQAVPVLPADGTTATSFQQLTMITVRIGVCMKQ